MGVFDIVASIGDSGRTPAAGEYFHFSWVLEMLGTLLVAVAIGVIPMGLFLFFVYWITTIPLRRQQRLRSFLDVLETGIEKGWSPERTVVSLAESRDMTFGARFHLLAAHLETGLRLSEGLKHVKGFVPLQLAAMLEAGEKTGDIRKILPACRRFVGDAGSKVSGATHYLIIFILFLNPLSPLFFFGFAAGLVPKFASIMADLAPASERSLTMHFLMDYNTTFAWVMLFVGFGFYGMLLAYCAGPWLVAKFSPVLKFPFDLLTILLPWRRKRMQRDFSAMLAVLLDSGVPEADALRLAAQSTANGIFVRRARSVLKSIEGGMPLTEAVQVLDGAGEFRWRFTNAVHANRGFLEALSGWHDALDAKAYQQEQAASQLVTTAVVLACGALVGLLCFAVFQFITFIIAGVGGMW